MRLLLRRRRRRRGRGRGRPGSLQRLLAERLDVHLLLPHLRIPRPDHIGGGGGDWRR